MVRFYNPFSGKQVELFKEVQNVDKTKPKRASVTQELQKSVFRRIEQDVQEWRTALRRAEDPFFPDRKRLERVYQDIILETHTKAVLSTRKEAIKSLPFKVMSGDEEDEDLTELLKSRWFIDFLESGMNSLMFGPTLVEFGDIVEDQFSEVREISRRFLLPEKREFRKSDDTHQGISIDQDPYEAWTLMLGDAAMYGELLSVAPVAIIKKATIAAWGLYNDAYGVPIAVAKTDETESTENMRQMRTMLENLPDARWGILDKEDEIHFVEPSTGTEATFKELLNYCDEEISKAILGQTMTTEDGSSRSQSEVHERVMETYTNSDKRYISALVNDQLIPLMQRHGIMPDGVRFEWDETESLSVKEQWEIDKVLVQARGYVVDTDYIQEKYGTPVEFQGQTGGPPQADAELANIENAAVTDFPQKAVENAQMALDFVKKNRGRGSKKAKQIARRIVRREPIGRVTLRDITSFAANRTHKDKMFKDSDAALNFYLVGGEEMISQYAPMALQRIKNQEEIAKNIIANVERSGDQ